MNTLNKLADMIYQNAADHGFWPEEGRNFGEMIALAHSELSEALESYRNDEPSVWYKHTKSCEDNMNDELCSCTPKPEGAAVELADCIIRCLDTLRSLNVDIDEVVKAKMVYNNSRPFKHGRKF